MIRRSNLRNLCRAMLPLMLASIAGASVAFAQNQKLEDEIVASLCGGRVIVHAASETIIFAAINQQMEDGAPPPRLVDLDATHVGILFGASEWRVPAEPKPIRLDRNIQRTGNPDSRYGGFSGEAEPDLETIGTQFLEKLRPLASQLHHKLDFPPGQPLLEMVVIGYGPKGYGPEVWTVQYMITQEQISTRGEFWQTRVSRPRFEQIYPPEKHAPKMLVESGYPESLEKKSPMLQDLLEGFDPRLTPLRSDPKFAKVIEAITKGQAQKAPPEESAQFLRAAVPLLYPNQKFIMGKMEEQRGFDWILPPDEPVEKPVEDKNRPAEAPSLRRRPNPSQ